MRALTAAIAAVASLTAVETALAEPVDVALDAVPRFQTASTSARFVWRAWGDVRRVRCALDGAALRPCRRAAYFHALRDGIHTFVVRVDASDRSRTARHTWRVDTRAPSVPTHTRLPTRWVPLAIVDPAARDGGTGVNRYELRHARAGGPWTVEIIAAREVTVLPEGDSVFQLRAIDAVGNRSAWSAPARARVDDSPPTAPTTTQDPDGAVTQGTMLAFAAGGAADAISGIARYEYEVEGQDLTVGDSVTLPAMANADGGMTVRFRAVDRAGNASAWTEERLAVDVGPPQVPVLDAPDLWQAVTGMFEWTAHDDIDVASLEFQHSRDGGTTWVDATDPYIHEEGETLVRARATDWFEQTSDWSEPETVLLDLTPPEITFAGADGFDACVPSATVTLTASDALSGVLFLRGWVESEDGTFLRDVDGSVELSQPGRYRIHGWAGDNAWYQADATAEVCIQ